MTIYIDITQLEKQRVNTGIQRVVKEFLQRAIKETQTEYKVLIYNAKLKSYYLLDNQEVASFVQDTANYKFINKKRFNIETTNPITKTIFFDIDSPWNNPYKRDKLYPILKNNGFLIYNFIYDLIPILLPEFVQNITVNNYKPFIKSVYRYSDFTLCDSKSCEKDLLEYKAQLNIDRKLPTQVVNLGSNFIKSNKEVTDPLFRSLFNKKYILFVGTIEPRKNQEDVLDAFETLSKKYSDLHLIFIGMKGWKTDKFIERMETHPLYNERLFWLRNIDDSTLYHFYKHAFMVTYLSKYEGYGLPIIESLQYGNLTITSNNSSMPEVGLDFVEYVNDDSRVEGVIKIISEYVENEDKYKQKKEYIKTHFKPSSWDQFALSVFNILNKSKNKRVELNMKNLKKYLKALPVIGFLSRWFYNLLRLNNMKHILFQNKSQLKKQQQQINRLKSQLKSLETKKTKEPIEQIEQMPNEKIVMKFSSTFNILISDITISKKVYEKAFKIAKALKAQGVTNFKIHVLSKTANYTYLKEFQSTDEINIVQGVKSVDLQAYYVVADLYLSLSNTASKKEFLLEAIKADIPVLTTKKTDVDFVLPKKSLLKSKNTSVIVERITSLLEEPYERMLRVKKQKLKFEKSYYKSLLNNPFESKQSEQIFNDLQNKLGN